MFLCGKGLFGCHGNDSTWNFSPMYDVDYLEGKENKTFNVVEFLPMKHGYVFGYGYSTAVLQFLKKGYGYGGVFFIIYYFAYIFKYM